MEKDCHNCKFELYEADEIPCKDCGIDDREYWQPKPQTNADRIRAMTDEELAKFLAGNGWECETYNDCAKCPRLTDDGCVSLSKWLKQPAEGE